MSNFIAVSKEAETIALFEQIAASIGIDHDARIINGDILEIVSAIQSQPNTPDYLLVDMGNDKDGIFAKLDSIASVCESNVKVVVVGDINELSFYRNIIAKGIAEYFVKPVSVADISDIFNRNSTSESKEVEETDKQGTVISFFPSASGDGATTVAINTAYCIAERFGDTKKVVLLDLDYQYGLVARNLDITANFGLQEVLEHRQGGLDATLLEKITTKYKNVLDVISAPNELMFVPEFSEEMINSMFETLKSSYDYIIVDLPGRWNKPTQQAFAHSNINVIVSQLSIKSVTHCRRLIDAMNVSGVTMNKFKILINRSGSKFKEEGITPNMFASTCGMKIDYFVSNDSKTISLAENQSRTTIEASNSMIVRQFKELSSNLLET